MYFRIIKTKFLFINIFKLLFVQVSVIFYLDCCQCKGIPALLTCVPLMMHSSLIYLFASYLPLLEVRVVR